MGRGISGVALTEAYDHMLFIIRSEALRLDPAAWILVLGLEYIDVI